MRFALTGLALLPAVAAWIATGPVGWLGDNPWPVMALAGLLGLGIAAWKRQSAGLVLLAFGLSAIGAQASARSRSLLGATQSQGADGGWPFYDLTKEPFPSAPPAYVSVQGFYRAGWTLDEFDPAEGKIADQSKPPLATLVPLLGDGDGVLTPAQTLVVARVPPAENLDAPGPTIVRGKVRPLDAAVLATLVQTAEGIDPATLNGVMVDALEVPQSRDVWTNLGVALGASLIAMTCVWFATGPPGPPPDPAVPT